MRSLLFLCRHAARQLCRQPLLLVLAVLPMALAMAALVTVFSVVNALLFKPLPGIGAPEQLVEVRRDQRMAMHSFSYPDFLDLAAQSQALRSLYAFAPVALNVHSRTAESAHNGFGLMVSSSYFTALQVAVDSGRLLDARDDGRGGDTPAAVISAGALQRLFGGDRGVIGQDLVINGALFRLVGVTAAGFRGHVAGIDPDFYLPLTRRSLLRPAQGDLLDQRDARWLLLGARLAPGIDAAQADAELALLGTRLNALPREPGSALAPSTLPLRPLPSAAATGLLVFAGLLGLLLLTLLVVACTNVAGLSLARTEGRRAELALRRSLGASSGQVFGLVLMEGVLLATLASALGLALAGVLLRALPAIPLPIPIPLSLAFDPDWRVLGCALLLALLATLCSGLLPAWRAARLGLSEELRQRGSSRLRAAFAVLQVGATVILLSNGAALLKSLQELQAIDPGMQVDGVRTVELDLQRSGYTDGPALQAADTLLQGLRSQPGISAASLAAVVPLSLNSRSMGAAHAPGLPEEGVYPEANVVSPGFIQTLRIDLRGRDFDASDRAGSTPVAIVNRSLATRLFGTQEPLGRSFDFGEPGQLRQLRVVGVIEDGQYSRLGEPARSFLLLPLAQVPQASLNLLLRTDLDPRQLAALVQAQAAVLERRLPPPVVQDLSAVAALALLPQRIASATAALLGGLGLLLAALGLYGLVAQQVSARRREIGVRMALGAAPRRIVRELGWHGSRLVLLGLALGIVPAWALARLAGSLLVGVQANDPGTWLVTVLLVGGMALVACFVPARRAARTTPLVALRQD